MTGAKFRAASGRAEGRRLIVVKVALGASLVSACAGPGQFPLRAPLWQDPDSVRLGPAPAEYVSPMVWDVGDQSIFYPLTRVFAVDPAGESVNVNSLDEVPDSSWFTNRIGLFAMTPEQLALGPCARESSDPPTPWQVTGAKPNGANPGFIIKDAAGGRHLVKFDGTVQGPRATAADVIVSKLYHAAGYSVPCNRVVFFDKSAVSIAKGAKSENATGDEEPLTQAHLAAVFAKAQTLPDGRLRASTSQFLSGKPIGPFTYAGTRQDDPNDIIEHQDRRELRGMRLLAAWTQHFDAREQNTLATWVETGQGVGHVRHNVIDFGDCFGSIWEPPSLGRRLGHSYYLDIGETLEDWFTFGLRERPWDRARFGPTGKVFGYYGVQDFDPERWKGGYPNPAFVRMSERDGAWMARIIARFDETRLEALVKLGIFPDPAQERELLRVLSGRRDRILERYLTRLSPLAQPEIRKGTQADLCVSDRVKLGGVRPSHQRQHAVNVYFEGGASQPGLGGIREVLGGRVCVSLPRQPGTSPEKPKYLIVDWVTQSQGFAPEFPARIHLYDLGASGLRVVGLERPESFDPPGL
jgi:hypothetical protein